MSFRLGEMMKPLLILIIFLIGCLSVNFVSAGCAQNSDCNANQYCDTSGTCASDLVHASTCNVTYVQTPIEFNGSCTDGECWDNSNTFICNRVPTVTASPNDILNFSCANSRILNWSNSSVSDPDSDSMYFNVAVGSSNGSSDYGTGTTNGSAIQTQINATGLTKVRTYYWSLQTCDFYSYCVDYDYTDYDNFSRTNCAPNEPTNLKPVNNSESELSIDFTWVTGTDSEDGEDPDYDADSDYFCIQSQLNVTDPCWNSSYSDVKTISEDNLITLDTSDLSEDMFYYWAMKTTDGYLNSSWVIYTLNITFKDLDLIYADGVDEILFYPNDSTSKQVEPECQTSTSGCIIIINRANYTINVSISSNQSYPFNYREGDTNWNLNLNDTEGNMSLWSSSSANISLYNRSVGNWVLNVSY